MLRIILWKIGFEWAHLKRALWPRPDDRVYYFAFGANLCRDVLERRRIHAYEAFDFQLEGAALRFSQLGFCKDLGYASADPAEGEVVYGRMYQISKADARRMDYYEGVPILKAHEKVFGEVNQLPYFYYRAVLTYEGLKPTETYLDYIVSAYREMPDVPVAYIEKMAATEVLGERLPQDQAGDFVDTKRWPDWMYPILLWYERLCLGIVEFFWNRSLFQRLIKIQ